MLREVSEEELIEKYFEQINRMIDLQTWLRWLFVMILWLTIGLFSFWQLRADLQRLTEFFTWAALRVLIKLEPFLILGIGLCFSVTLSTLIWQSQHILFGFGQQEYLELLRQVQQIEAVGQKHPFWRWVWQKR